MDKLPKGATNWEWINNMGLGLGVNIWLHWNDCNLEVENFKNWFPAGFGLLVGDGLWMPGKHQIRAVGVNKLNLSTRHLRHPFALKQCGFISNRKLETAFGQVLGRIKNSFHPSIGTDISDILRCIFGSLGYSFNSFNHTSQYWYGLGGSQRGKNGQSGPNSSGRRKDVVHAPKRQTQLQLAKSSNFRGLYYKPWGVRNYWKTWKNVRVHDDLSEFKRCHSTSLQSGFYNSWGNAPTTTSDDDAG